MFKILALPHWVAWAHNRLTNGPQEYLGSNPWSLWMLHFMAKGFSKLINLRILRWRDYSKLSRWTLTIIIGILTRRKRGFDYWKESSHVNWWGWGSRVREKRYYPLSLKMEKRTTNQGIQEATGNRKRKGNNSFPRALKGV